MLVTAAGLTRIRITPTFPETTAPTCASPGLKNEMVPELSTPATSKGEANQTAGFTSSVFPESSLATALNCSRCPTSASVTPAVTYTDFTGAGVESVFAGPDC